ncbi:ammonia-forming cytochrome c nitrite reductase subunit c552 [Pontiella agarivorans]|uniref:nitrite reductase (cytochrome; ammonia-forming) n=1 Tax=Pontiella agarivorans TaxID=3038953 RepID=A0ABU5MTK9_9BACT|nr:ammonia-forming cytochrome c nitrite reductase subunit c552 [Pontiella agarivorans]MDZ8117421.1 ammonia-forming cytochrome c nitrite reductase subunit c552 [Pontiella agarivorans]
MSERVKKQGASGIYIVIIVAVAILSALVVGLLTNITERKVEARQQYLRVVEVTEDTTDPAVWGKNWPKQYDSYKRTALSTKTTFGGHGGSEALPEQKIDRPEYHWLKRMFLGYAFSIDYRDRRGHAYMLFDQEQTDRHKAKQSGSCLHCHASLMPVYRELGDGDAMAGMKKTHAMSYWELNEMAHDMGHAHPVSCVDCHDPESMAIRVTRPGFIDGIQRLANSDAPVPAIPSIDIWRQGERETPYDPNEDASRNEMRSFVCGQCHVEYYCSSDFPLTFPWGNGLSMDGAEKFWDETKLTSGERFYDYKHKETGAPILKAQHPEFELWSQGVHARSGVSCSDCHMPYMRDGASKVSDHWVRSPLLNVNRSCQTCHRKSEQDILDLVDSIQQKNYKLLLRGGEALNDLMDAVMAAKESGATEDELTAALEFQRKAQWRLDYIAAENSMGFHAPQEAARILAEAADYARQGQVEALKLTRQ